jgi:beta-glucosidase/6-phospho-beta-glucosidase/beta-galactosidase
VRPFIDAAQRHEIDVIWDLFHYGYPEDLDPFGDEFVKRFAEYCYGAAKFIAANQEGPHHFTPVNEPSFFAWAGAEVGRFAPHCYGRGPELKVALARAAIAGINAIRSVAPGARMVNVDPVCRVVPPLDHIDPHADAEDFNQRAVFEAWDMIAGRTLPELGGSPGHLDIIGVNYYWTNQWEIGREEEPLALDDPRHMHLAELLTRVWERYGHEMLITETSHVGEMRAPWLDAIAHECDKLLAAGVPLRGVCLYPILGMPEWHDRTRWARMGLWDLVERSGKLERHVHRPMLDALRRAQSRERQLLARSNALHVNATSGADALAGETVESP